MKFILKEDIPIWKSFMRMFHTSTESGEHFYYTSIFPKDYPLYKLEMHRCRQRGYQYPKLCKKYWYNLHLIDYTMWKDTALYAYVVLPTSLEYIKHPQIWIETCETFNKFSQMYARFMMKDIIKFGKKWFHKHLNNIISDEHKKNALQFKLYYPVAMTSIKYNLLTTHIEDE